MKECLAGCRSLEELEQRLLQRGIDTRYRIDEATGKRIGISFRYQEEAFKGSRIDREFSLPRLEERLAQQQALELWQHEKLAVRERTLQERELVKKEELRRKEELQPKEELRLKQEQEILLQTKEQDEGTAHRHRIRIS